MEHRVARRVAVVGRLLLCQVALSLSLLACGAPAQTSLTEAVRNPTLREIARRRRLEIAAKARGEQLNSPGRRGMSMVYSDRNAQVSRGDEYSIMAPSSGTAGTRSGEGGVGSGWSRSGVR